MNSRHRKHLPTMNTPRSLTPALLSFKWGVRTRWALGALVVGGLLAVGPAWAGFSSAQQKVTGVPLGAPSADKDIMEAADKLQKPYPPVQAPVPPADLARLRAHRGFALKSDAEIQAKVENMRRVMVCAIDLISRENAAIGEGLRALLRANRLCIGLAPEGYNVGAVIMNDGKAAFNLEPINFYLLPCERITAWGPELFDLANTLGHEGLHGIQEVKRWGSAPALEVALDYQCAEIEASEGEVARAVEMLRVLDWIDSHGTLPSDARGMVANLCAALLEAWATNPVQRKTALDKLRASADMVLKRAREVAEFRRLFKKAAQLAIEGHPAAADIRDQLTRHRLFQYFGETREFAPISHYYTSVVPTYTPPSGDQPPRVDKTPGMRQIVPPLAEEHIYVSPFTDTICDISVAENANGEPTGIFIGGVKESTGQGIIFHVQVDPATKLVQPGSAVKCLESPALGNGFLLVPHLSEKYAGGEPVVYPVALDTGIIHAAVDVNGDGLPDIVQARGGFAGLPNMPGIPVDAYFSDGDTIVAAVGGLDVFRSPTEPLHVVVRTGPAGDFLPQFDVTVGGDLFTSPALHPPPRIGDPRLFISGSPGQEFEVTVPTDGVPLTERGVWSDTGNAVVDLTPSVAGWVRVRPVVNNVPVDDGAYEVPVGAALPPGAPPTLEIFGDPVGNIELRVSGPPGATVDVFGSGPDLTFGPEPLSDPLSCDRAGIASVSLELPDPLPAVHFFRAEVTPPPPPVARGDTFTTVPGLTGRFDVSFNDDAPPDAKFVLVSEPTAVFHPSQFAFHGDGTGHLTSHTSAGFISFTYRIVTPRGQSEPATVLFFPDFAPLEDPDPVSYLGADHVRVPVLTLGGESYPLHQFYLGYFPDGHCLQPHWHTHHAFVFPLDLAKPGLPDMHAPECGFGTWPELAPDSVLVPVADWNDFLQLHP